MVIVPISDIQMQAQPLCSARRRQSRLVTRVNRHFPIVEPPTAVLPGRPAPIQAKTDVLVLNRACLSTAACQSCPRRLGEDAA